MKLVVEFNTVEELRAQLAEFQFEGHTIDIAPSVPPQEFSQAVTDRMKAEALHAHALAREALHQEQAANVPSTGPVTDEAHMDVAPAAPAYDPNAIDLSKIETIAELEALDTTGMSPGKKSAITKRKKAIAAQNAPQDIPVSPMPTPGQMAHPATVVGQQAPAQGYTPPAQTTLPRDQWPPFDLVAQDGSGRGAWYAHNAPVGVATQYDPGTNTLTPTGEAYSIADQLAAANANNPAAILTAPPIAEPQAPAQQATQANGEVDQATRMDFIRKVATDGRVPEAQQKAIEMFGPGKGVNTLTGPELTHFMAWYNGGGQ